MPKNTAKTAKPSIPAKGAVPEILQPRNKRGAVLREISVKKLIEIVGEDAVVQVSKKSLETVLLGQRQAEIQAEIASKLA